jgi:hypothetical protein
MSSALVDAKALCNDQILDVLNHPMFTIFQIQHDQIADRVDSDNKLLYHFKQSMSKMKEWNSSVVHDFCAKLVKKFPAIKTCEVLATEMIKLTCKILNESHDAEGRYIPADFAFHDVLHAFIVECSKVFIEHPEWFSHGADSTEYQTCLNNARIAMKNREVVYNATRKYVTLTSVPASSSSSSSSPSSSAPSSPSARSSPLSKAFAGAEPMSASGIYLTAGDNSAAGDDDGEESGQDELANQLQLTKNINVVTGDVETVAVPKPTPVPSFADYMAGQPPENSTLYPGSMESRSVYPSAPSSFVPGAHVSMPQPNPFGQLLQGGVFGPMSSAQGPRSPANKSSGQSSGSCDDEVDESQSGEDMSIEGSEDDEDESEDDDDDGFFYDDDDGDGGDGDDDIDEEEKSCAESDEDGDYDTAEYVATDEELTDSSVSVGSEEEDSQSESSEYESESSCSSESELSFTTGSEIEIDTSELESEFATDESESDLGTTTDADDTETDTESDTETDSMYETEYETEYQTDETEPASSEAGSETESDESGSEL